MLECRLLQSMVLLCAVPVASAAPWASSVESYAPGTTPAAGFTDPNVALGSPERFTGEGSFPSVVSPFNPAFGTDEIVSIGEGGHLTLRFDAPITNDPAHPFGIDLILFGNTGFADSQFPDGVASDPVFAFGLDDAFIEVSADGSSWAPLGTVQTGRFPTDGYLDSGPFDATAGSVLSDFQTPVDPSLTLANFDGLSLAQIRALYAGSGGGTPIDIASSGLSVVEYVRVSVPDDLDPTTSLNAEVDALSVVPSAGAGWLLGGLLCAVRRRR